MACSFLRGNDLRGPGLRPAGRRLGRAVVLTGLAMLAATLGATLGVGVAVAEDDPAKSAVLIVDANSGRVLQQSAADAPRHPASLAKLMTLYLAFERIEQGRLGYQSKIRFSANAAAAAPSKLELEEGAEITLIDALKVLITKSANDVAIAIAEHIAGSEAKFARLMTQKAHQLGMAATIFRNASGLPDDEQVTTARDMITLALHLEDDFPKHYPLFATRYFTYNGETFRNHNALLFHFAGTDGLKTGYTRASGFNLVASVRRGRKHVVGVVFGGASAAVRNWAMQSYLTRALAEAASTRTRSSLPVRVARKTRTPDPLPGPAPAAAPGPIPGRTSLAALAPLPARRAAAPPAIPASLPVSTPASLPPSMPVSLPIAGPIAEPISGPPTSAPPEAGAGPAPAGAEALSAAVPPGPPPTSSSSPEIALPRVRQVLVGEGLHAAPPLASADQPGSIEALLAEDAKPRADGLRGADAAVAPGISRWAARALSPQASATAPNPDVAPPVAGSASPTAAEAPSAAPEEGAAAERKANEPATAQGGQSARASGFVIQIGAYQSEAEAQRQLALARTRAPLLLDARVPITQQVAHGERPIFRARYAGFEAAAGAADACQTLQRLGIACLVIKGQ